MFRFPKCIPCQQGRAIAWPLKWTWSDENLTDGATHTPKTGFWGDSNGTKKTILSFPIQHNKTVVGKPPVMVWNPYNTNSKIGADIKSCCKPIHTPKATVRNPYAKDANGGGHIHSFSGSILSPQAISAKTHTATSNSGIHDKSNSHTLIFHNPKQLFSAEQSRGWAFFIWN